MSYSGPEFNKCEKRTLFKNFPKSISILSHGIDFKIASSDPSTSEKNTLDFSFLQCCFSLKLHTRDFE